MATLIPFPDDQAAAQRCGGCKFWNAPDLARMDWHKPWGECRRRAPVATTHQGLHWHRGWPWEFQGWAFTARHSWCGEYEPHLLIACNAEGLQISGPAPEGYEFTRSRGE